MKRKSFSDKFICDLLNILPSPYISPAAQTGSPVHICNTLLNLHIGGPQHQCLLLGKYLHNNPFTFSVCSEELHLGWDAGLDNAYERQGISVTRLQLQWGALFSQQLSVEQRALFRFIPYHVALRELILALAFFFDREQPDILCSWHPIILPPMDAAIWAALLAGVPRIVLRFNSLTPEIYAPYRKSPSWLRAQFRLFASVPRIHMLCNSRAGARALEQWMGIGAGRISVISNAIDTAVVACAKPEAVAAFRAEVGADPGTPLVAGVFRLVPEKNGRDFIAVLRLLRERLPNLRIVHAGPGPLADVFRNALDNAGLLSSTTLLGGTLNIPLVLQSSQALLCTSKLEGLANIWLEAMFYGCPPVVMDVGGAKDAIEHGISGFVHPPGDIEGMCISLYELLHDVDLAAAMAEAGRKRVLRYFTAESSAQHARNFFQYILR